MKAPADLPTVSCDRKFETRVSSMMMAMHAGGLPVDIDRRGEGRRQPLAVADASSASTSARRWSSIAIAKPFLIGDGIFGVLDAAVLEPEIVADDIRSDLILQLAVGRDLEHFDDAGSPSLCPAKNEPSGQPNATQEMVGCDCNCDQEHDLRLLASRGIEHFFGQQRAHRHHARIAPRS